MHGIWPALAALIPPIGVGALFFVAMRYILHADRNERAALARLDAQENLGAHTDTRDSPSHPGS